MFGGPVTTKLLKMASMKEVDFVREMSKFDVSSISLLLKADFLGVTFLVSMIYLLNVPNLPKDEEPVKNVP